jgi:hypothetical protein
LAPSGSSVAIQATAQEGRALARLNEPHETYNAIERVQQARLTSEATGAS